MKRHTCISCGYSCNAVGTLETLEPKQPKPGDGSICLNCGQIAQFDENLDLRKMEDGFFESLPAKVRCEMTLAKDYIVARGPFKKPDTGRAGEEP